MELRVTLSAGVELFFRPLIGLLGRTRFSFALALGPWLAHLAQPLNSTILRPRRAVQSIAGILGGFSLG